MGNLKSCRLGSEMTPLNLTQKWNTRHGQRVQRQAKLGNANGADSSASPALETQKSQVERPCELCGREAHVGNDNDAPDV